ncbi:Sensor histidine kinase LiaS [Tautonia plasticadhaerens]|uniref:histidine kinase n=1 Tax=Tautonia plasticadhaerens TaxID=2527974 RepID=A0A518HCS8_9BACT|nr:Sensor histidine kinase LiaS [Tautonia plasticadhaerens]
MNPTVELASGIHRGRFLGRANRELGLPDSLCRLWEQVLREAIASRGEVGFAFRFDGPNGARSFLGRYVPELDPEGRVASVLGIGVDITERRALQEQLLATAAQEQRRIAQDLHDDVGQGLTGAALMADAMVQALAAQGRPEAGRAARLLDLLGGLQQRVRVLCRGLMMVEIDSGRLMSALTDLADKVDAMDGIRCTFECPDPMAVADPRTATYLFRIAQEAVSNAMKHGGAQAVCIGLRRQDRGIRLEIRDDGRGFPPSSRLREGMGLKIMRYRAESIGGMLEIRPARGGGSKVACQIESGNGGGSTHHAGHDD